MTQLLPALPIRQGHFLLESGYHSNLWFTLDALFVEVQQLSPFIDALAEKLRPYSVSGVCGPLLGGAFLAQAIAMRLGTRFYYTVPGEASQAPGLFRAAYTLPPALVSGVRGARVAIVDDAISAGSSVKATTAEIDRADATGVVIGALLTLGDSGVDYFKAQGITVERIVHRPFDMWLPGECPMCTSGEPLFDPQSME